MKRTYFHAISVTRRSRGALMFGMAALILVLGMMCGTILLRSLDTYRATARTEMRLQARAAAEGTVVVLQRSPDREHGPLEIGPCKVAFAPPDSDAEGLRVPFTVSVLRAADRAVMEKCYIARYDRPTSATWRFVGLETVR